MSLTLFFDNSADTSYTFWPEDSNTLWVPFAGPGQTTVLLRNGEKLKVRSLNPGVVQVMDVRPARFETSSVLVRLASAAAGSTTVQALDRRLLRASRALAEMRAEVFSPRLIWVGVFLATDQANRPRLGSGDVASLLQRINAIIQPSTNLIFRARFIRQVDLGVDVSTPGQSPSHLRRIFWRLHEHVRKENVPVPLNLFLVRDWGATDTTQIGYDGHTFGIPGSVCVVGETGSPTIPLSVVAAHELAHALGVDHDDYPGSLMQAIAVRRGTQIFRDAALRMRQFVPTFRTFLPLIDPDADPSSRFV